MESNTNTNQQINTAKAEYTVALSIENETWASFEKARELREVAQQEKAPASNIAHLKDAQEKAWQEAWKARMAAHDSRDALRYAIWLGERELARSAKS